MDFCETAVIQLLNSATAMTTKLNGDIVSRWPSFVPRLSVGVGSMGCNEDTADVRKSLEVSVVLEN